MFNPNSRFYATFSLAADLVIVNFCMIVAALPIVTADASIRAGAHVAAQLARDEGSKPAITFAKHVRNHPLPTRYFVGLTCLSVLGIYELIVIRRAEGAVIGSTLAFILEAGLLSGLIVLAGITVWFYPECNLTEAAYNALVHLPRTLLGVVILLAFPAAVIFTPVGIGAAVTYVVLFGFSLPWYLIALVVKKR